MVDRLRDLTIKSLRKGRKTDAEAATNESIRG